MPNRGPLNPVLNSDSDNESETSSIEDLSINSIFTVKLREPLLTPTSTIQSASNLESIMPIQNNPGPSHPNNATMATASLSEIKEYLEMVPVFRGEPELLSLFVKESEKIITYFYDTTNENNPRNDFLTSRIRAKIQGDAALFIANCNITDWKTLRSTLITAYSDKRDDATLTIEMVKLDQGTDTPFEFFKKVHKILNAQISYANLNYGLNAGLNNHFHKVALKTLLNGLKDPLGSLMRTKDPQNLESALHLLTNTYQKEINAQKANKNPIIQKTRPNFPNPAFMPGFALNFNNNRPIQNYSGATNPNTSYNNRSENVYRGQTIKRPAFSSQNHNVFRPAQQNFRSNNDPIPMSISTNNTYRPPNKIRPSPNFNNQETYEIDNETLATMNLNDEVNDESVDGGNNEITPYNDFLDETAFTADPPE